MPHCFLLEASPRNIMSVLLLHVLLFPCLFLTILAQIVSSARIPQRVLPSDQQQQNLQTERLVPIVGNFSGFPWGLMKLPT